MGGEALSDAVTLYVGDCLDVLPTLPAGSVDAVVTDPPYGLEFMGKEWDAIGGEHWRTDVTPDTTGRGSWLGSGKPTPRYGRSGVAMQEWFAKHFAAVLNVLKPGGYLLSFSGTRTYHRLACGLEDAGFEVRDCLMWVYGSGFPKHKACLKPAYEPILLARKPGRLSTPLNIDECRIGDEVREAAYTSLAPCKRNNIGGEGTQEARRGTQGEPKEYVGRWPANVLHDGSEEVLEAFAEYGERPSGGGNKASRSALGRMNDDGWQPTATDQTYTVNSGTAARFFYTAKASQEDRGEGNRHPTVKPQQLMRWLVRLVCPAGGVVLDPFAGSGSTGLAAEKQNRRAILVERDPQYAAIIRKRFSTAGTLFAGAG
jgi:DNA modification methylase